jgi:hypothetical protein
MLTILLFALGLCALIFTTVWIAEVVRDRKASMPSLRDCLIGLFTLFLDTLGIPVLSTSASHCRL